MVWTKNLPLGEEEQIIQISQTESVSEAFHVLPLAACLGALAGECCAVVCSVWQVCRCRRGCAGMQGFHCGMPTILHLRIPWLSSGHNNCSCFWNKKIVLCQTLGEFKRCKASEGAKTVRLILARFGAVYLQNLARLKLYVGLGIVSVSWDAHYAHYAPPTTLLGEHTSTAWTHESSVIMDTTTAGYQYTIHCIVYMYTSMYKYIHYALLDKE